jgi:solute carrier family 13 (sodium-dependent dicarboxylate transporter), member 2/3/5
VPEIRVGLVFLAAAVLWVARPRWRRAAGRASTTPASRSPRRSRCSSSRRAAARRAGTALLDWSAAKRLPWGVLLLFGGGLSLAAAIGEERARGLDRRGLRGARRLAGHRGDAAGHDGG